MAVIRKWIWLFFALALPAGLAVLRRAVRGTDILNLTIADTPLRPIVAQPSELTTRFPERFPMQVAVLLTRGSNSGFGVVHALQEMGIPFFVTRDLQQAIHHHLVLMSPSRSTSFRSRLRTSRRHWQAGFQKRWT